MKRILVCTDGSQYAGSVYEHAAWVATRAGASAKVLHTIEHDEVRAPADLTGNLGFDASAELMAEIVALEEAHSRVARLRGKALLEDAQKQLTGAGVAEVTGLQRHGSLVEAVKDLEEEVELVVIGKRGEHVDFAKGHLGSNLERVVRGAQSPVLVAARAFKPIEKFLIAFDGGPSALKAVHFAATNGVLKGLECHLLAVGKPGGDLEREMELAAKGLEGAGYAVKADLLEGDAEEVISTEVVKREVDLLVMGAYGHSRIRRLVIGSTTTALIRDCHVPVLLFR